ncbi:MULTISPECIES: hypothetical protein [Aeromonas]|uniref:Uncharacterized protein n=1 Tax=Aeromonas caviae TaxID=648 RepID=A0AAJ5ZFU2_AERCA|nr:hypothetical protein [Aeromonas caviae]RWT77747.1 hypothetical protein DN604_07190 [Aeromonas caviae]WFG00292.1 hypothetical protein P5S46_21255 [Aeromonas caviae]WVM48122.1 hypothetical protein V0242_24590 [Aeromonas hydrophila]
MNNLTDGDIAGVLSLAKELGFKGWGGHSASAALAINRLLFEGQGEYVVACNQALLNKGCLVGHVAVRFDGHIYDADAEPKTLEDIESWGELNVHDVDFMVYFDDSDPWNADKATDVVIFNIEEAKVEGSLLMSFSMTQQVENMTTLEKAITLYEQQKEEDALLLAGTACSAGAQRMGLL